MKSLSVFLCSLALVLAMVRMAEAALIDRGGGLIYDDVLDITWLQDANYAQTSGYDTDGLLSWWSSALAWAEQLTYGGYDDWRLPTTVDGEREWGISGYTTAGYYITSSEMGYMYYVNLGNLGAYERYKGPWPGGTTYGLENTGPFINLQAGYYWSGTEYAADQLNVWTFNFNDGEQDIRAQNGNSFFAWAVRDGDVDAVPIPSAGWLLGSAFIGLVGFRRKYKEVA